MSGDFWTTAVARGIISNEQAQTLAAMQDELKGQSGFRLSLTHLLWAGGTALIIAALILLGSEIGKESDLALAWLLTVYAAGFGAVAYVFSRSANLPRILWGCLGAAAVVLIVVASAIFHDLILESAGLSWAGPMQTRSVPLDSSGVPIEVGPFDVLLASGLSLGLFWTLTALWYLKRSGFLPIWLVLSAGLFVLHYESLRLFLPGLEGSRYEGEMTLLSFGLGMLVLSLYYDQRAPVNHGFWVNKIGWLSTSAGMAMIYDWGGGWEIFFALICLVAAFYSVFIRRPGGVSFAALGLFGFLSDNILEMFPSIWGGILVCTLLGAGLILGGLIVFRHQDALERLMPAGLRAARPIARDDPVTFGF
ncbi:hypothetical protein ACS3SW_03760 [Roseobacteraceae bacterium S113]